MRLDQYLTINYNIQSRNKAAELIKEGADTIRRKVFDVIVNKGNVGATADEVAELLSLSSFTVRPRVTELFKQGKIERRDKRKNIGISIWRTRRCV